MLKVLTICGVSPLPRFWRICPRVSPTLPLLGRNNWELLDPSVADPIAQDNEQEQRYTNINGDSILKYTEGEDKLPQCSYLDIILSNWVPDNRVYRLPKSRRTKTEEKKKINKEGKSQTNWEKGGRMFQEYCFGRENLVSSAANSVSLLWQTNDRLRGTH